MAIAQPTVEGEIQRYLLNGVSDPLSAAWQGNFLERSIRAHNELRSALIGAVRQRETNREHGLPPHLDLVGLTRTKVEPMVRGLFRRDEQQVVLAVLEKSVVLLTRNKVETLLLQESFDGSAWTLANLYLAGIGAELLSEKAPRLVGFSQNTTCYLSPLYFHEEDRFADFIVHEAAHVFHNCKRATIGLPEGGRSCGSWTSRTGNERRSHIRAKPMRGYSNSGSVRQNGRPLLTSSPSLCALSMNAWMRVRWRA